ncbi:amidohydrolase family protein [Pararhodobacter marinus]|uniref:amidohydrolase family protein n=1 Tax=Pararhodobacter marinus TaxID=2184063 RepID=UPI001AEFF550|nr:amidohydrolase family protein [Pararhodobacter marinus]
MIERGFDCVLRGGRVMDPATGFDRVADIGLCDGRIVAIGGDLGAGRVELQAEGLVVAPGFVDIHAHGQSLAADRMQAFDGVTTALELEVGALPVRDWYAAQSGRRRVCNYGTSAAWLFARQQVKIGLAPDASVSSMIGMGQGADDRRWSVEAASDTEAERIADHLRAALEDGAIGIGIPNGYAPGAGIKELALVCDLAAEAGSVTFTHIANASNIDLESSVDSYVQIIGLAGATGAHMHVCHLNSTSLLDVERAAQVLGRAQAQGLPITVEAYPYGTGSTVVSAGFLQQPDFTGRTGSTYDRVELLRTGERFTDAGAVRDAAARDSGDIILWHFLDTQNDPEHQRLLDVSVLYPGGAIASDALPWVMPDGSLYEGEAWPLPETAVSHPRSSGTFTRFLGDYVRERGKIGLMEALAKCTIIPTRVIEASAPAMRRKGRVQVGCDADLVVFDPAGLRDCATFRDMNRPAQGMRHVIVNGVPVIRDGALDTDAAPGRAIRGRGLSP